MAETKSLYSLHPGFSMEASSLAKLVERTGKNLDEWIEIVKRDGPSGDKARREWLKEIHGFSTNYCSWLAQRADGRGAAADYNPEEYVEAMFAGKKVALRPIYDAVLTFGLGLGDDVKACPCQTMVPLYRKHVFAQIKPTTNTRVDVGFALRDMPATGRLIDTGGFAKKDRITHRIPVSILDDFDEEVKGWLRIAYESNP